MCGAPSLAGPTARPFAPQALAVTDAAGALHVVELPRALRRRGPGELRALEALVEREAGRRAFVAEREAARERQRKEMEPRRRPSVQLAGSAPAAAAAAAGPGGKAGQAGEGDAALTPEQRAEAAYLQLEDEWRAKLGLPAREVLKPLPASRSASMAVTPSRSGSTVVGANDGALV